MKIDYAETRSLLRRRHSGVLGTQSVRMSGYPFVTALPYVPDGLGRPVFLLSALAEHTRNLLADPHASLLVMDGEVEVLEAVRSTLLGEVAPVELDAPSRARYLRYSPQSADYLALGDFRFFRLEPEQARFIGGFGRMGWIEVERPPYVLDPLTEQTAVDNLTQLAPVGVAVLGLDFEGLDLRIGGVFRRVELPTKGGAVDALQDAAAAILGRLEHIPPEADGVARA